MRGILKGELNTNWRRVVEIFTTAQTEAAVLHTSGGRGTFSFEVSSITGQSMNKSVSTKRKRSTMSHHRIKIDCLLMHEWYMREATADWLNPNESMGDEQP
jgi:hypothetical protein